MAVVVVPWRHSPQRERVWRWVKARYAEKHPDWPVHVSGTSEGPWVKADAVMPKIEQAGDDVVVVADADCWCAGLESAVLAVTCGVAEWAVPHKTVYRLTEDATERLIGGEVPLPLETERRPYHGVWGGGILVAHRDTFLRVPLDPRFQGPGQEDEAWGVALWTLAGQGWRGTADLLHLWHDPLPRLSHRRGSLKSWKLYQRYARAREHPEQMEALLKEIDVTRNPDGPAVHHRSAAA